MKGRIKEDDNSVPILQWILVHYSLRKRARLPYLYRKKDSLNANEEILFDCNKMAEGHAYFRLAGINISPDNSKAIFGIDTVSRRQYVLKIKDLNTGEVFDTPLRVTTGGSVWAKDNDYFFYTKKPQPYVEAIYRHRYSDLDADSDLIFEEKDETFSCY